MTEVTRGFCWHQNFVPWGCLPLTCGYIHLFMKRCVQSQRLKRFFLNLQQMTIVMRPSCWHQNFSPNGLSAPAMLNLLFLSNHWLCPQLRRSWGGILVWASVSVRTSMCVSVHYALHTVWVHDVDDLEICFAYGQERLEIGSWNLICWISMKNKRTRIFFFSVRLFIAELCPFFRCFFYFAIISLWNLVNNISGEPLGLGSWFWLTDCDFRPDMTEKLLTGTLSLNTTNQQIVTKV